MSAETTTPASRCRFALRGGDITPPVGIYHRMWGAAAHDRSEGIHRPLQARVAVFEPLPRSSARRMIWVSLDHCLFGVPEITQLLDDIERTAKCAAEEIWITFTHTHGAGLLSLDRSHLPGGDLIPGYLRELGQRVGELTRQALDAAVPAVLTYGTGRSTLAAHRDFWDANRQQFVCGYNPSHPADDTLLVIRATADDGQLLGTLVNYACHPTTLAWDNRLISPDFPGAMRELVESATGQPCLFLQGASGELGPKEGFVGDPAVADRNGRQLGHAVLATLAGLPPPATRYVYQGPVVSGATIGVWKHQPLDADHFARLARWDERRWNTPLDWRPDLPTREQVIADRDRWRADEAQARAAQDNARASQCRAMIERQDRLLARLEQLPAGPHYPLAVRLARVGDALWLAVPGEHYSWLQRGLRQQFPGIPLVVTTLLNGWGPSYVCPADVYGRGIYQETIAVVAAGSLERIVADVARAAAELFPSST